MLPAILWILSLAICIVISFMSVRQHGRFVPLVGRGAREAQGVTPVGMSAIGLHLLSVVLAAAAYLIGSLQVQHARVEYSYTWSDLYKAAALPSAVVIVLAIVAQLVFLILRARTAQFSLMNARLDGSQPE